MPVSACTIDLPRSYGMNQALGPRSSVNGTNLEVNGSPWREAGYVRFFTKRKAPPLPDKEAEGAVASRAGRVAKRQEG